MRRCDDAKWGRVDVLFNNAGIGQGFVPPEDFALDDFNRVMTTNLCSIAYAALYLASDESRHPPDTI